MARTTLRSTRRGATGVATPALLLLLAVALARGEASPSAADTESGSGLGAFLRRLMLDLFAWLGSLFGLGPGADDDASNYPNSGGGNERRGSGRFPPRGQRVSTASPQDVEHIGEEEISLVPGSSSTDQHPEFSETSEERSRNADADGDLNASPEAINSPGAASAEQLDGADGVRGLRDASADKMAGDDANQRIPARVRA